MKISPSSWVQLPLTDIHKKKPKWIIYPAYIEKRLDLLPWITRRISSKTWQNLMKTLLTACSAKNLEIPSMSLSLLTWISNSEYSKRLLIHFSPSVFYALLHILKCLVFFFGFFFFPSCFAALRNDPVIIIVSFKKPYTYISVASPLDSCPSIISWKSVFSFIKIKCCQRNLKNTNPKGCKFKREHEKTPNSKYLKNSYF